MVLHWMSVGEEDGLLGITAVPFSTGEFVLASNIMKMKPDVYGSMGLVSKEAVRRSEVVL